MFEKPRAALRFVTVAALSILAAAAFGQAQVTTYHNDNLRTGLNPLETILKPNNVNQSDFGLLFALPVDGQVYAQPLYLPKLTIPGLGVHNVLFVATEHDSVYAFDADSNTGANANPLWHVNFGPSIPNGDTGTGDINPEIGITGTPVIYTTRGGKTLLYVVSTNKTTNSQGNPVYTQQLHALSVLTGAEELNGPLTLGGQVKGTGDGTSAGIVAFQPLIQNQRAALLLVPSASADGTLYVTWASHGDNGPYHGWVFIFDADKLTQLNIFNTSPNATTDPSGYPLAAGGIWQGGCGPASDGTSIYYVTGNGTFNTSNGSYGDSVVRMLNKTIAVADYFTPFDQLNLDDSDADFGSGGVILLPASASGNSGMNLAVACGKEGSIFLMNTANLGKTNASSNNVVQELQSAIGGIWGAPAYFNNNVYFGPVYSSLVSFPIVNGQFTSTSPTQSTPTYYQYPGPEPAISANGTANGIVWAIQSDAYGSGGPAILHAYPANILGTEIYNSSTGSRDTLGPAVKFAVPTIVNGKVYVGCGGEVGVFGLGNFAENPGISPPGGTFSKPVTVKMSCATPHAEIRYTTDGSLPTAASTLYTKPISLTSSVTLTAKAFMVGGHASGVVTQNFLVAPAIGNGTGLLGQYYNGQQQNPTGTPTATEIDPQINFSWGGNSPITGVAGTNWAGVWTGQVMALTTGTYTLTTQSDDGVEVFINGNLLINGYVYQAPTYYSATINLTAGQLYNIQILYFQGGGGSLLQLLWAAPGIPTEIVPTSQLFPSPSGKARGH